MNRIIEDKSVAANDLGQPLFVDEIEVLSPTENEKASQSRMTDDVKALREKALKLRKEGLAYAAIGKELGITRQYVEILIHYEKYHDEQHKQSHKKYVNKEKQKDYSKKWREKHPEYYKNWYDSRKKLK